MQTTRPPSRRNASAPFSVMTASTGHSPAEAHPARGPSSHGQEKSRPNEAVRAPNRVLSASAVIEKVSSRSNKSRSNVRLLRWASMRVDAWWTLSRTKKEKPRHAGGRGFIASACLKADGAPS